MTIMLMVTYGHHPRKHIIMEHFMRYYSHTLTIYVLVQISITILLYQSLHMLVTTTSVTLLAQGNSSFCFTQMILCGMGVVVVHLTLVAPSTTLLGLWSSCQQPLMTTLKWSSVLIKKDQMKILSLRHLNCMYGNVNCGLRVYVHTLTH